MAKDKERVTLVHYVFSANDDLFAGVSDLSRYKVDKTVDEYIRLCESELRRVYPKAMVEVINSDSAMSAADTYVESWDDFEESSDSDEITRVNEICNRIYNQRNWFKLKEFIPIIEVKNHSRIPLPAIRWLCVNGLLEGISNTLGHWELLFEKIVQIHELVTFLDSLERLEVVSNSTLIACYLENIGDIPILTVPTHLKFLVAARDGFHDTFFEPDTSLFLIRREKGQAQVTVEHFIDAVDRWSDSRWIDPEYVKALGKQSERKGIEYSFQEVNQKGKKEIVGISFFLSVSIRQEMTLKTLITDVLNTLLVIFQDAELHLKGFPTWDEIYETKGGELRFHKEFLEPLLRKMEYPLVLYTHSNRGEHGRDFVLADTTRFQDVIYYGLQAKAGSVSGGATSTDIDELVRQIKRAFVMPVIISPEKPEVYISTMIIAISGKFTNDAIEVIRKEMPKRLLGCVYFWNKGKIISLRDHYWKKEND